MDDMFTAWYNIIVQMPEFTMDSPVDNLWSGIKKVLKP
jgi:hypothetical protein